MDAPGPAMIPTIREDLAYRLRQPRYWIVFMTLLLPFLGHEAYLAVKAHEKHWATWVNIFGVPIIHTTGLVWLSPLPWRGIRGGRLARVALRATVCAEAYIVGMIAFDSLFGWLAGAPVRFFALLPFHLAYHGPFLVTAGAAISMMERLGQENEEVKEQAREAQSRALQGQLHPHVLFNALNGLAELVHKSPDEAETSIRHLSDLLRQVLQAVDRQDYTLKDERILLENYLDMEGLRLGKRLRLSWNWDPALEDLRVPPLVLQPLVENALKHGIAPCRQGGELVIQAAKDDGQLVLAARNTGQVLDPKPLTWGGVGLRNLSARLDLLFGTGGRFALYSEAGWTVSEVRIDLIKLTL